MLSAAPPRLDHGTRLDALQAAAFIWCDGAALPYLGGELRLHMLEGGGAAARRQDDCLLCSGGSAQVAAQVLRWYRREARVMLFDRLAYHAARAGLPMPPLRLSDARTRWGSLSARGVVSLNWRLIKASAEELDYVICHELAHFRQRNHSPAFWREVALLFPDYARVRTKLRLEGRRYFAF
jgi:predicted metal-dependent hydrolase